MCLYIIHLLTFLNARDIVVLYINVVHVCVWGGGGGGINDQCDPHLVITRNVVCTKNFNYGSKNRET